LCSVNHTRAVDFGRLQQLRQRPPLFEPGDLPFWTDPRVAPALLRTHLDPTTSLASRPPAAISATVDWIIAQLGLRPGARVLDLGCGPGLYCTRLARRGMHVTGIDFSENSLEYAMNQAAEHGLDITYRQADYVRCDDFGGAYDAILLIFGDFCALPDPDRDALLPLVRDALAPNGAFVLDVTTPRCRRMHGLRNGWEAHEQGLWRSEPHLVLTDTFAYEESGIVLEQYVVLDCSGEMTLYRNWYRDYRAGSLAEVLARFGLRVESLWGDLAGAALPPDPLWIGAIAREGQ
jgi:SAM-dependent methyltransferase